MNVGDRIKRIRTLRGMTQKDLVGDYITRNMLSKIEYHLASQPVIIEEKAFTDVVTLTLLVKDVDEEALVKTITDISEGTIEPIKFDEF